MTLTKICNTIIFKFATRVVQACLVALDKLNDTVPNHTFITTIHETLFIYNRTKITG